MPSTTQGASSALAALDGDADELRVGQDADLGCAHLHPRGAEILDEQRGDAVGEGLDEAEMPARREGADAQRHLLVIDGVGELVAREHVLARQADLEVDGYRLQNMALAPVDADERFDAQVLDDDRIHDRTDSIESRDAD